ncbi:hypothetical protein HMPREF1565_0217 [Providencia alcalifaciens RIMD 1656011]|uniref:Uncharacterized protein n=2 Tax=Providencia alcalifaciens TaxID=126385 RepID=B6XEA9_9GAMM|nr:hypothetical protein PROVALCAL_01688 [Providencia alcalifaciens DSM 30120]EUD03234.1 hypothetical protein HMPREF1565_0217 [Providencia alcalifaciens RIMD 1656011]EUD07198.1 hypothetical protein HMPREF1564_0670 [Providencia alcalifaciens R90-1475]EUD09252.1 hypothetical protein HMPREF1563_3408 [Providencia alcalifaciens 205/92]
MLHSVKLCIQLMRMLIIADYTLSSIIATYLSSRAALELH